MEASERHVLVQPQVNIGSCKVYERYVHGQLPLRDILVLSYYAEERSSVEKLLHDKSQLNGVEVMSVDAAQGHQNPISMYTNISLHRLIG